MAKYIIDIEDEYTKDWINDTPMCKELCMPISVPNRQRTYHVSTGFKLEPYTEPDRKAIEDEVWELADYMCRMGVQERDLCFGFQLTTEVTANLSYQEAKSKFEAWLKQKDEICVGDEIYSDGDFENSIVMETYGDGSVSVYTKSGCIEHWYNKVHNLKKTGRHFDEIEELLKKMRDTDEG